MRGTGPLSSQRDHRAARTGSGRREWRRTRRAGTLLLAATMAVTILPAQAWAVPGPGMSREGIQVELPDVPETDQIGQDESAESNLTTADQVPVVLYEPQAVTPWSSGDGTVDLTGLAPGDTLPVDDLPVALGVPSDGDPTALAGSWTVGLAAPEASQAAGVAGLIMKITPPATADPAAEVALAVDYTAFADLYGPQAADRFGFLLLPDCVYDDPDGGDCATDDGTAGQRAGAQPGSSSDIASGGTGTGNSTATGAVAAASSEVKLVPAAEAPTRASATRTADTGDASNPEASMRRIVTGTISVGALIAGEDVTARAAAASGSSSVVGVLDTGASAAGDFTATPLLSAGSWAAGASSGAFTYGYQVQVPETSGGLMPQINLSYSSQSVDGRTSATNNQASWIGDGWDYSAGAITRSYANCRQDSTKAGSNNASHRTGDLCWGSNNATMSLGGMTTELVFDDDEQTWITANGDGSKVQLLKDTGLANGDADGEYWVVTTRDGTRHFFGRHRLPGWSSGDPVTNSVLTAPVYGNHAGEPCYQAGNWAGSACTQAWRWSLDYVEDVHGNAMSLWWAKETNYYARNFNFKDPVRYDRGGYLSRIDYGQRADSMYSAAPVAQVAFTVAERCFAEGSLTCTDANFASTNPNNYRIWYDTPADLGCVAGQKCWNSSPAFFSRKRLDKITTSAQRQPGTNTRQTVDEYQLKQSFPILRTGLNTALWLESVTRTGYGRSGNTNDKVSLNAVRFEAHPDDMPNRVRNDDRPGFARLRIGRVINEYGGETIITYKQPTGGCATGTGLPGKDDTAALRNNTRLCYPSFWHPDPAVEDIDWFHKYVVDSVEELPAVDGAYPTVTRYSYANAGWKLAEQEFTKKSTRTYSQFAGFAQTTVITGDDDPAIGSARSKSVTRYFRGMGDTVSVHDIDGVVIAPDAEPFAGRVAEELTYTSAGDADTAWLTRSVTVPAATELGRRDRDDGLSPLRAWRVTEPRQVTYTRSSGTGDDTRTQRVVEARTSYEATYGLPTQIESLGDTGRTGDESCTVVDYAHRTDKHVIGMTRQLRTSATTCAAADFDDLTTLASASRVGYDNQAYGTTLAANTRALVTQSWSLRADGSGFQSDGTVVFDAMGRVESRTDPDGKTATTTFEPAVGQTYRVVERNSLGHQQTQEIEPGRGAVTRTTDPNGHVSQASYDPLGRLIEAWGPGRTPSAGAVPDFKAEYHLPAGKPPYVVSRTRGHDNRVETAVTLYDGLGRERQSQQEAVGGGRLISDTLYNTSGEIWQTNNAYFADGAPSGGLFTPLADTAVPNSTRYTYDGLGRVVTEMPVLRGTEAPDRATRYTYGTDHSTVINPVGAASYRIYSDAVGRTARVDTFTNAARTEFTSMRYEYDPRGQLARAAHSADPDRPWTWSYDRRGRLVTATDPDSGATTLGYDHRDRPLTSTNARGITVWNGYDELSRPVAQRLDGASGTLLAEYSYDTAPGGIGLPAAATRYTDGLAYTQQVGGYTDDYQPTSTTLTLPQQIADTWGLARSYTYNYTYTDTGLPASVELPAVGRLPAEKVLVRYTADGLPLSVSGQDWYGSETVYSPYGQVLRSALGAQPYRVWTLASFDEADGALTDQRVFREQSGDASVVAGNLVSQRSYAYDPAGNVLAIREHAGGIAERQCFNYSSAGALLRAWTASNQASCAAAEPAAGTVAAGPDGSGYWQEYEYDLVGNRTRLVEKDLGGDVAKDATTTYSYGKLDGSQPRTLTSVRKQYVTPAGAQVTAEAKRLYEATGETKSVESLQNGDGQTLSWTYDGQVERITGQGEGGKTAYLGVADKCLDLNGGHATSGRPIHLHPCNSSIAQRWSFTVEPGQVDPDLGTLRVYDTWCIAPSGTTVGSPAQLQRCDGTAGQRLTRTSVGQLRHQASGLCLTGRDGATVTSVPVILAVCDVTATDQQWAAQDETRHIYGPDGGRLLTMQNRQATLHLGDAVITVALGGVLVQTQRTYSAPGGSVLRYAYRDGDPTLVALATDHQGSPYAEIGLGGYGTMPVRIIKRDPFGNERAAAPLAVNLQTKTGFLGATRDDASGYTPLGARLYDPVVGRFLSADPVLDLADPAQSNGYTYAHNNPVTHSDPSGLSISLTSSEKAAALAGAGLSASQVAQANSTMGRSLSSIILSVAWDVLKEFIGLNAALGCFGGNMWSCVDLITEFIPWAKAFKAIPRVIKAVNRTISAIQAWQSAKRAAERVLKIARAAETTALNAKKAAAERAKRAAQALAKKAADKANTTSNKAVNASKKTGNPVQKQAQAKTNPKASSSGGGGGKSAASGKSTSKAGGTTGASSRSNGGSSGGGGGGSCPTADNSFTPGTKVLMADGTTKRIEQVKPGDKVIATDPETGDTTVETVTATITGDGVKHLVKITIDTDGDQGPETAEITATDGHPFWVPQLDEWIDATDLQPGQWLHTSTGTWVQITAIQRWTVPRAAVHNLTISHVHTYHVMAGTIPVLVHNCGSGTPRVFAVDSSGAATALPVHEINSALYPDVADNFTNALAKGKSPIVTRLTGRAAIRANRNAAQAGLPRPDALGTDVNGQALSWEEFPFASTNQGGAGAMLRLINRTQNTGHGRDSLWPFLRDNGIGNGDQYYVRVG
ncbi:ricin-type beta-trefoil lectin domain protein [Micromonospora sp. NBC_01813]|uniref:ricin-type beta-trefoil lectin domain protein n=1 Tax=Micromonospora sp. NBC_01813 TaxID=2975988 RepID=UPI002DDA8413|nr:ricin-type beta-trefoil lectin domain protein [Micromonospora sp. NBC_01813]WSA08498.1 ricin-type beta-trefoil lectin domain protein [Micromonospora sp. NBC_01813]